MLIISDNFYKSVLLKLLNKNIIKKDSKILAAAAGERDKREFLSLGFTDVTISNLDVRMNEDSFLPYKWSFEDAENLNFRDNEFEFVIIHHGLHHCVSPHKALLELYRVAEKGVLAFEPIDNFITRAGCLMGFSENYELTAVFDHGFEFGGIRNTGIPNYVYRWTTNEIKKTIKSCNPAANVDAVFYFGLQMPFGRLKRLKNKLLYIFSIFSTPPIFFIFLFFHRMVSNRFGFFIKKPGIPGDLYPWLQYVDNKIIADKDYLNRRYKRKDKK